MSLPSIERDLEKVKVSFNWEIPNFCLNSYTTGQNIFSPKFGTDQEKWFIELYPRGINEECKEFVSIRLYSRGRKVRDVEYSIFILDSENQKYNIVETTAKGLTESLCAGDNYKEFIKQSEIENNVNRILPDNILRILCEVTFNRISDKKFSLCSVATPLPVTSNLDCSDLDAEREIHLSRGPKRSWQDTDMKTIDTNKKSFRLLFDNEKFSDVKIVCTGNKGIYAHKAILVTQNQAFQTMLMSDTSNDQSVIEIKDIDFEVFREMIRYIYTGEVDNICQLASKLVAPAQQYLLNDLSLLCEKSMDENLSITNSLGYYSTADFHGLSNLKKKAANYIMSNIKDIVKVPEFQTITHLHPNIILDICKYYGSQGE